MPEQPTTPLEPDEPQNESFDGGQTIPNPAYRASEPTADYEPTEPLGDDTDEFSPAQAALSKPVQPAPQKPTPATDTDIPFNLPQADMGVTMDSRNDPHKMVTMPLFREPGVPDAKQTLPGSGGFDPNPDMSQRTVANMPAVGQPTMPMSEQTVANMPAVDPRWQRNTQAPNVTNYQGGYMPPPPQASVPILPKRRPATRAILGLRPGCFYAIIGLFLTMCGGMTMLAIGSVAVFIPYIENRWSDEIARVDNYQSFQSSFIYDRYGNQLFEVFNEGKRVTVEYSRFPQYLIDATIAIEDDGFWTNIGIDVPATTLAFLQFVGASPGENTPGGSTITQQLVRNVLFDPEKRSERSASRKAEEIILALLLTQRKSKEEILALYLNEIYYGNLAYGAQTASQVLFGKNVEDLTLGEAALLAGLPQAPASLDPLNPDPEVQAAVYARQRQVLDEMLNDDVITQEEHDNALLQGLTFAPQQTSLRAPHFTVYAQRELENILAGLGYSPEDVVNGGFQVYTTIDQSINDMALQATQVQIARLSGNRVSNGAVIILKPTTGEILGMVGSIDYDSTVIDGRVNVTISLRQPGSTMKAFTYAAAMERGMSAGDVLWDTPTDIGIPGQAMYTPRNYDGAFHGPMTMRTALANSYNIPAVQTLRLTGVEYFLDFLHRFGVTSLQDDASNYGLSLTLGGGEISLVELTAGYSVFANQGIYVQPTSILCITDNSDNIIYQYENGCPASSRPTQTTYFRSAIGRLVLDPRIAFTITDILADNGARTPAMGGNSVLNTPGIQSSVKTGTTNDYKDNWTVGYTSNVAIGVWTGNNDNTPMQNVSGLAGAAPIWNSIINNIYNNPAMVNALAVNGQLLPDRPQPPGGISQRQICDVRRLSEGSADCPRTTEWMLDGGVGIPDANNNLQFMPEVTPPPPSGYVQYYAPGVYQAYVFPLPPQVAATVQFSINPANGDKQPPAPRYCLVPEGMPLETPGIQDLLFIQAAVTSQGDSVEAERWAQGRNLAYMPNVLCPNDIASIGGGVGGSSGLNVAFISSPTNGQVVNDNIPIIGTVQFDPSIVGYYHFYIIGGPFGNWTPLGVAGTGNNIVNGQLETLAAAGLPNGTYTLRLALMAPGGDAVQAPYEMQFTVAR
jgi:membrane peptidoglycan carboxypeptidase